MSKHLVLGRGRQNRDMTEDLQGGGATWAVVDAAEAPTREMQWNRGCTIQLVNPRLGSRQLDCHINVLKAGGVVGPYHLHSSSENVYYILEGEVRVRIDTEEHDLRPGMAVFIPPNIPHSALNVGGTDARLLEIYTPPDPDFVVVD